MSGPAERDGRPAPIGDVIRGLLGERRLRGGVSLGRLVRVWGSVVGDPLGRVTAPASLEEGTLLVVAESTGWAAQLRFLADDVRGRANEMLGADVVRRVRVVVARGGEQGLRGRASRWPSEGTESRGRGGS